MEFIIAASVIGMGYVFNNKGVDRNDIVESDFITNVPRNRQPNGDNVHENKQLLRLEKTNN